MFPNNAAIVLFLVVILHHVCIRVDATYVDDVVRYCRIKERRFAAMEDKYVVENQRDPNEPLLAGPPFPKQGQELYKLELSQRPFECIADILHVYWNEFINSNARFRALVRQCKAIQPTTPQCDPFSPYRNINGTCNNLFHPKWGSTFDCFRRIWPANYEGVSGMRRSVKEKKPLPNTRNISIELIKPVIKTTENYNALFAFFGQAIAHDIAQFPFALVNGTEDLQCCKNTTEEDLHPQCAPIYIDSDDPFYSTKNVHCFNVIRIVPCDTCSVEKRIQINIVTGFLDCSLVYGVTDDKAQELRRNDGSGKLKSQEGNSYEMLPPDPSRGSVCGSATKKEFCFSTGDARINQQFPLMAFQTVLLEEHNRIAGILKDLNPHWGDEKLYQESRKILIAEWQVIVYKEYLPILLGPKLMQKYGLNFGSGGEYTPLIDPTISVEFDGAAFRVHSILPGLAIHGGTDEYLRHLYLNATPIYHDKMSEYLFKMARTDAEKYDWFMPRDVTNYLYNAVIVLFLVIILHHVCMRVDATYVDDVVRYCRIKERRFAAMEDKYVLENQRGLNEPLLAGPPFPKQGQELYKLELSQRPFECIADTLHVYWNQVLNSNARYRALVRHCKAIQPTTPHCDPFTPYRNINGTCNNLFHPKWGSTFDCFQRLWPANYEGVSGIRRSVKEKKPLPNTRNISLKLIKPVIKTTENYNALFAFFGQPIAHDLAQFPFTLVNGTEELDCCENRTEEDLHPQCAPIYIDSDDPFYSTQDVHCFNVIRVVPCDTCSVEKRIQINIVTGFLDCSLVYGPTDDKARELRRNDGSGKLKSQKGNSYELLPPAPSRGFACGNAAKQEYCFSTGDTRVNQQFPLMSFQTVLLEEHNRIAGILKDLNPHWDDEKLYQESRKILIAEWQVIVYKEYLPILLGPKLMQNYGLNFGSGGQYSSLINPAISVEFDGASFRVHSILPGLAVHGETDEYLRHLYLNATPIYHDKMSEYLFNMARTDAVKYDWFMPRDITNYLYKPLRNTWGFDLGAIDILRGRDVGLPTYAQTIEYLEHRLEEIKSFDELKPYISPECINIFKKLYEDVRDIDFFAGIICEKIPPDMIISPTAARIIVEQFQRTKYGDRYFVEFDTTLTPEQRQTLMNASFAKFICDNTEVESFQPSAFRFPSEKNALQSCSSIPGVDLSKWREIS